MVSASLYVVLVAILFIPFLFSVDDHFSQEDPYLQVLHNETDAGNRYRIFKACSSALSKKKWMRSAYCIVANSMHIKSLCAY